ncbi:ABC transporter substrate-binding protein [Pseudomonas alcaligenes]|uniref:ABC transporter substrate-binding protein n=1 Tax=Aquipseudomonas alcaligenes TaxID=43263 RepID=A0ABR7RVJ6_AQUAC|nr:ABC transporter substrate-binding protein [Pseudomonas alcaligenes]
MALWLGLPCAGWAEQVAPLRVEVDNYWPPFRMSDDSGRLQGLDIDLLDELSRRTGLQFEIQVVPWARALADMRSGHTQMMTGLARTSEREAFIDYLQPSYYACSPRFYGPPPQAAAITEYAQLRGPRIGYVLDSAYFQPFDADASLTKVGVKNEQQLLQMQLRGRVELLVGTDCQLDYQLRDPELARSLVKLAYRPQSTTHLYIGFSRESPRPREQALIGTALRQMLEEGWLEQTAARYWGTAAQ